MQYRKINNRSIANNFNHIEHEYFLFLFDINFFNIELIFFFVFFLLG